MTHEAVPPGDCPTVTCAAYGGSRVEEPMGAFGKPLETMGRKARGCRAEIRPMLVRLHGGKPRETAGRKARG